MLGFNLQWASTDIPDIFCEILQTLDSINVIALGVFSTFLANFLFSYKFLIVKWLLMGKYHLEHTCP